ncbi:FUSC family protein [Variovorax robiniae]|uniref:FUSC family protein n=1 Tax=Variovorax robiniae TaxID=1836199 RepID=A0ABU8XD33_9BURK
MPGSILADLALGLRDEWRAFSWRSPRALQAARPLLWVLIAVTTAHALGLHDAWWAAITAFMVMQADFGASFNRGVLRIVGTLCGAALGFVLGPAGAGHPILFVILMTVATWAGLYAALRWCHSYAWVLALVTFAMVMCEALAGHAGLGTFAVERIGNVLLGTAACMVVAGLTDRRVLSTIFRRGIAGPATDPAAHRPTGRLSESPAETRNIAVHALHGAVVVAILSVILLVEHLGSFAQALVTTIAVLVVPLEAGTAMADVHGRVVERMAQRFVGCLAAQAPSPSPCCRCSKATHCGAFSRCVRVRGSVRISSAVRPSCATWRRSSASPSSWCSCRTVAGPSTAGPPLERLAGVLTGIAALGMVLLASGALRKLYGHNAPSADA